MATRQAVLGMERASFYYGSGRVFEDVSFLLDDARTALVGENGAGKSTLLKCLTGALELNAGQIIRSRGLRVGSVPQDVPAGLAGRTVLWLAYPAALLASGFFTTEERGWLSHLRRPGELLDRYRAARNRPAAVDGLVPEAYEAELMDDDARP